MEKDSSAMATKPFDLGINSDLQVDPLDLQASSKVDQKRLDELQGASPGKVIIDFSFLFYRQENASFDAKQN